MADIRIREHEHGHGIRLKEESIHGFDAAEDLLNTVHNAGIKGKESVENRDEEKPADQAERKLREGKDRAVEVTERYVKRVLEEDELLESEGAGTVPSDSSRIGREQILNEDYPGKRSTKPTTIDYQKVRYSSLYRQEDVVTKEKERPSWQGNPSDIDSNPEWYANSIRPDTSGRSNHTANPTTSVRPDPSEGHNNTLRLEYPTEHSTFPSEYSHQTEAVPSAGTEPVPYENQPVSDPSRLIKTREASSVKEYHPSIKYADKSVKTADTAGKAIKTEQAVEAEETTRKSAQVAGTAGRAAARRSANAVGQAAANESANTAANSAASSAAATAAEASAESAAASNWIVWVVIAFIIIIMVLATNFLGSVLTYRMTGNDEDIAIRDVISEINTEFQASLDELRNQQDYDDIVMEGNWPKWRNVLAVYFAKNTDGDDPTDIDGFFYVSERGKEKLKKVYKDMVDIDAEESTYTETELVHLEETDEYGHEVYELQEVEKTRLTITVTPKSAYEMAEQRFYMNSRQIEILYDLLSEEYDDIWPILVYGYFPEDAPIVEVALQEVGNIGGEKYWRWYGFSSHVEWCACFVSWCADECGYINDGIIPKYSLCAEGVSWFQERGQWLSPEEEPAPGMIVFFDWDHPDGQSGPQDGHADHTGIVERVEDDVIYTVEGNAWDVCMENRYPVGHYEILGYGTYNLPEEE